MKRRTRRLNQNQKLGSGGLMTRLSAPTKAKALPRASTIAVKDKQRSIRDISSRGINRNHSPPIQAPLNGPRSASVNNNTSYAVLPNPSTLLSHQHLSKKLLNWNRHATTIHIAFRVAASLPRRRRATDRRAAVWFTTTRSWGWREWACGKCAYWARMEEMSMMNQTSVDTRA